MKSMRAERSQICTYLDLEYRQQSLLTDCCMGIYGSFPKEGHSSIDHPNKYDPDLLSGPPEGYPKP